MKFIRIFSRLQLIFLKKGGWYLMHPTKDRFMQPDLIFQITGKKWLKMQITYRSYVIIKEKDGGENTFTSCVLACSLRSRHIFRLSDTERDYLLQTYVLPYMI